jgi:hypothetical protein
MVRRAPVGFGEYFYEAPWTNSHATVELVCGSPEQEEDIEVWYETVDGTAVAGRDYGSTQGSYLFPKVQPNRRVTIQIPILRRPLGEDKTFRIRVTRADFPAEVSRSSGDVPVTITGLPRLSVARFETNIFLTWRASATNYMLEASAEVETVDGWQVVDGAAKPIPFDPRHILTLPVPEGIRFFRLRGGGG